MFSLNYLLHSQFWNNSFFILQLLHWMDLMNIDFSMLKYWWLFNLLVKLVRFILSYKYMILLDYFLTLELFSVKFKLLGLYISLIDVYRLFEQVSIKSARSLHYERKKTNFKKLLFCFEICSRCLLLWIRHRHSILFSLSNREYLFIIVFIKPFTIFDYLYLWHFIMTWSRSKFLNCHHSVMLYLKQDFNLHQFQHSLSRHLSKSMFIIQNHNMNFKQELFTASLEFTIMSFYMFSIHQFNFHKHRQNCCQHYQINPQLDQNVLLWYTLKSCHPHWMKSIVDFVNWRHHFPDMAQMHEQRSNCPRSLRWFERFHVLSLFNLECFQLSQVVEKLFKTLIIVMMSIGSLSQSKTMRLTTLHEHCFSCFGWNIFTFLFFMN